MYPQGAQNVRCARCGHITAVPPAGGGDMAQLVCSNTSCRVVLMYPRGASQVQCSMCGTVNCAHAANQISHLVCAFCHMTLMFAYGAQSVKCAVCNNVTAVTGSSLLQAHTVAQSLPESSAAAGAGASGSGTQSLTQSVVVENPPSLDKDGNEVQNFAVGVTSKAKPTS
ncbi:g45 [Coccomyxa elongata]